MSAEKCLLCGVDIPEGLYFCPQCKEKYSPPENDIIKAFDEGAPVECNGIKYGCISAIIVRKRVAIRQALKVPHIVQLELMSSRTQTVTIAAPKEVKVLKDWSPKNE